MCRRKKPRATAKALLVLPVVAAQAVSTTPVLRRQTRIVPQGSSLKSRTACTDQRATASPPTASRGACPHRAAQLETPAGGRGQAPAPQPARGTPVRAEPARDLRAVPEHPPPEAGKARRAPSQVHPSITPSPHPPSVLPLLTTRRSSAVTQLKNSQRRNDPKPQTGPTVPFGSSGTSALPAGAPGTAQPSRGPALAPRMGRGFAEPPPAPARPRHTNCSLRRASRAAAGAWTPSVASN